VTERRLAVFRSRLRPGVDDDQTEQLARIAKLVSKGGVSIKQFTAIDGERLSLIEWASPVGLSIWSDDADAISPKVVRQSSYATFSFHVCAELRATRFDAVTGERVESDSDPARLRGIAERWLLCFEKRELDGLLALYADDATHTSPKIRARHPETGGVLRGKAAMRAWWQDAFDHLPSMRYEARSITADGRRVFMEYVRTVDGEPDLPVAEVLDVAGGKIIASRVFHG
jgi:ketosteroid isomerase-like protein